MAGKGKRKPKAKEAAGNGVMALVKELWQAAVELRDSIEPADYKRYVLPLIFLRFLSIRYKRRHAELTRLFGEPKIDYYTTNPKAAKAILSDPDEYRAAGAFIVPERASWDYIRQRARADDIKVILDEALELLEKTYSQQLKGLLPPIYAGSNLDNESVAGLINLFSKEVFEQDHNGEDLIGRVYEYFIGEFANSEGKRGGEYFTPLSIVERWWQCWSLGRARCSIPAAAPVGCSSSPTSSRSTADIFHSSAKNRKSSRIGCVE